METNKIPEETGLDSTVALLRDGYNFIKNRCISLNTDIFKTRLMGMSAICFTGEEAAAVFYDNTKFIRKGATPKRIQKTLFGEKGVQTLDGESHRERKKMFMSLMSPEKLEYLASLTEEQWMAAAERWENVDQVVLLEESQEIMCRVAFKWSGIPVSDNELHQRSFEFGAMVDAFGGIGTRHRKGKLARASSEKWIKNMVTQIRENKLKVQPGTVAHTFAIAEEDGKLLDVKVAVVEIINILRPIVAIGSFIAFAATALHQYPQARKRIADGDDQYAGWFTQEVRRFFPFTPFLGAKVKEAFVWKGYKFPKNKLVLLDVYGTDHDSRTWERPNEFIPERFRDWKQNKFNFIPQGGGDQYSGHRCAGEWVTIQSIQIAVKFLSRNIRYQVPEQDLKIDLSRMPTAPNSHFVIQKVKVFQPEPQIA